MGWEFNGIFLVPHPSDAHIFEPFFHFYVLGLHFSRGYLALCLDHNDLVDGS
jgi:hypothetical protein